MGYIDGEKLIAARIEEATGFNANNVRRGAWGVLNSGNSDHYAILRSGGSVRNQETFTTKLSTHRTVVEIWQRLKDDVPTIDALYANVAIVVDFLDPYRKMGDTASYIRNADITSIGEAKEMWTSKGDGPSWLKQEINVDWSEEDNVTYT